MPCCRRVCLAQQVNETFDVVFIDPPFALSLHQKAVQAALPHLKKDGFLYLENESEIPDEMLSKWGLPSRASRQGGSRLLPSLRSQYRVKLFISHILMKERGSFRMRAQP